MPCQPSRVLGQNDCNQERNREEPAIRRKRGALALLCTLGFRLPTDATTQGTIHGKEGEGLILRRRQS